MATITKVSREAGSAYRAVIRLQGIKRFSKTFRLRKDAKSWAERMERNIDEARAYANSQARDMTLVDLIAESQRRQDLKSRHPQSRRGIDGHKAKSPSQHTSRSGHEAGIENGDRENTSATRPDASGA